jgi:hypothetical protein
MTLHMHVRIPIDDVAAGPHQIPTHQLAAHVVTLVNSVRRDTTSRLDKHVTMMAKLLYPAKGGVHRIARMAHVPMKLDPLVNELTSTVSDD